MSTPPNEPPESRDGPLQGKPPVQGDVAGTPLRAVVVGLIIDNVGTELVAIVLSTLYQASLSHAGMTDDEIRRAASDGGAATLFGVLLVLCGSLCSVAGGYACARVVLRDEYRVGAVMATISCMLSGGDGPVDLQLLYMLSTFACVMLGVMYGERRNRRSAPPPGAPSP